VACSGVGGSCASSSDCCNPSVVQCKADVCSVPPPK
jgi:hypothetical protein